MGFVLGLVPYREHDAMVHFLGENVGMIRLVLPGYYKATSKQSSLGLEFSKVNYRFNYMEHRLNRIIGGELVNAYLNVRQDFDWLMWMSLISELMIRTYDDDYRANYLSMMADSLQHLSKAKVLDFVVSIIVMQGFSPDVSGCTVCGASGVNCFSIEAGGYLCADHAPHDVRDDRNVLLGLNQAFRRQAVDETVAHSLLRIVIQFLEFHGDYRFNAWQLIEKVTQ